MAYTQYTLGSFTAELASTLSDPAHVYWVQDELNRAVCEGLLHWGALTGYWVKRGTFNTVANTVFYDLSSKLPALRSRAYTFDQLYREVQYHIYEPATGVVGGGTGATTQFNLAANLQALARMRNEFVVDSRIPLTAATINASTPPPAGLVQLPQDIALIQRASWRDGITAVTNALRRSDVLTAQRRNPDWNLSPGKPYGFSQAEAMPGELQLIPPPMASGALNLIYAQTLNLDMAAGTSFALPDELVHAVKYGAMASIFGTESPGYDPIRAKYCSARYTSAVELAQAQRSIVRVLVADRILGLSSIADFDSGSPFWETITGTPGAASASYDLIAFRKVPNAVFSITCDVVSVPTLPVALTDPIDLGREELPYLFDYCRHILSLKLGGGEFVRTASLYDNFLKGAQQRSRLIKLKVRDYASLFEVPKEQEEKSHAA